MLLGNGLYGVNWESAGVSGGIGSSIVSLLVNGNCEVKGISMQHEEDNIERER